MLKWLCRLSFVAVFATFPANAAEKPDVVKLCIEDEDSYPWLLKNRPGLSIIMMQMVEKRLDVKLEIQPLPWKRCMDVVKHGAFDGLFKISFKTDRMELGQYPMMGDKPDTRKRMLDDTYSLYRLKGSNVKWDGKSIRNAEAGICAQPGFSITDQIKAMGIAVDDGTRVADENLKKLLFKRVAAVALQTQEGDASIAANPEMREKIERIQPPLAEKPYYLIFSKRFVTHYDEFSNLVWDTIEEVRESPEYKKQVQQFR